MTSTQTPLIAEPTPRTHYTDDELAAIELLLGDDDRPTTARAVVLALGWRNDHTYTSRVKAMLDSLVLQGRACSRAWDASRDRVVTGRPYATAPTLYAIDDARLNKPARAINLPGAKNRSRRTQVLRTVVVDDELEPVVAEQPSAIVEAMDHLFTGEKLGVDLNGHTLVRVSGDVFVLVPR